MNPIILDLPVPPSTNRLWRHANGRTYLNSSYVAWRKEAWTEVLRQKPGKLPPHSQAAVIIRVGPTRRQRDLDNLSKASLDLLQLCNIVSDDKLIADLRLTRDDGVPKGRISVEVKALGRAAA